MDDFDFDFGDFDFVDENFDYGSLLNDIDWNDINFGVDENFDFGSLFDGIDWNSPDFGVDETFPGGDTGLEDVVITGTRGLDPYEVDELTSRDELDALLSNVDPYEIDQLTSRDETDALLSSVDPYEIDQQTSRDETDALLSSVDPYEIDGAQGSRDEDDALTPTKEEPCPPGSEQVFKYRDGSTMTLDCKGRVIGSTPKTTDIDQGDVDNPDPTPGCPPGSNKTTKLANGWTIVTDCKGNVVSSTGPGGDTTTTTPPVTNDWTKWLALLGGILGLLNRPKGADVATYKGGIPTYTATRGTPVSPTAGGRRPGAAGLGSLTGGITYTKAAGGGLMDLAGGGRAARYLRGGTDGMADKIQTSIDGKQPARLSHGEFVIPADVVSHLGNGNSDAGADVLYDMMAKVRKARTGTSKQGKQINPRKFTPA